jgi:N-hydroxyarylamine O-acetyltransferase
MNLMNEAHVDAYLARIGAVRPDRPDVEAFRVLQRAHLTTVPFESGQFHITLDRAPIVTTPHGRHPSA